MDALESQKEGIEAQLNEKERWLREVAERKQMCVEDMHSLMQRRLEQIQLREELEHVHDDFRQNQPEELA